VGYEFDIKCIVSDREVFYHPIYTQSILIILSKNCDSQGMIYLVLLDAFCMLTTLFDFCLLPWPRK